MNLNNNWTRNIDTGKWTAKSDTLQKSDFEAIKQEFKSYRFYQKCLSGSTYVGVNSVATGVENSVEIQNIYDILLRTATPSSYYYDFPLQYIQPFSGVLPANPQVISATNSISKFVDKVLPDYNFTLKNLFTPERLIKDQKENLYYVDLATTLRYDDLSVDFTGLVIDGVIVKEGHKILVKDQFTIVTIATSLNPDNFFSGYYEVQEVVGTNTSYKIPSANNGIYIFSNKRMVRTDDLDTYDKIIRYSICVKLGETNREKQYRLKRLKSEFFPEYQSGALYPGGPIGESMYFEETHNWISRQRVDYNNLFELSLQDTIKHATQSLVVESISTTQSFNYSYIIPQRTITIGEFGSIINDQEGISNFINNKYKTTLRSISQTNRYYWICGDEGIFLRVDKIDFSIKLINLNFPTNSQQPSDTVITPLLSVQFYNDLRGAVVGKFNQVWVTSDSGMSWQQVYLADFDGYNYNKVLFTSIDKFYVAGDNGVFIEFEYNLGNWFAYKRRISKFVDGLEDEFVLVDDITDMVYFENNSNKFIALGCELSNLYLYDISSSISATYSFLYIQDTLNTTNKFGDINGLTWVSSNNSLYFSTFDKIYSVNPLSGNISGSQSNIFSTTFSSFLTQSAINSIFNYENELIYTGNFSLWSKVTISGVTSSVYDSTFFDRLKPRLLFMDYDIGSKLYWFDDFGQYRIPNRYEIPTSYLISSGTNSHIGFNRNTNTIKNGLVTVTYSETNWITYFKDRQKTFQYHTNLDSAFVVEPSFTFSSSDAVGKTFSYITASVTTKYNDIVNLMPSAVPPMQNRGSSQSSRFRDSGIPITTPTNNFNLFFYDYLGIWYENFNSTDVKPEIGDVLHISSDVFEGNFIINRTFTSSVVVTSGVSARAVIFFNAAPSIGDTFTPDVNGVDLIPSNPGGITASNTNPNDFVTDIVNFINADTINTGFSAVQIGPVTMRLIAPPGNFFNGLPINNSGTYTNILVLQQFLGGSDPILSEDRWSYFYTDFNENILNNINSSTGFTVRDLNKYPLTPNGTFSTQYFVDNFNKHYISHGYSCEIVTDNFAPLSVATQSFRITPKFSQFSAYYNLQSKIDVLTTTSFNFSNEIKYASGFLNFGYSPTYNLLSYLNYINPTEYVPTKEFLSMPNWVGIPGPDNSSYTTQSGIWIDVGLETNKLNFGRDLKYIWDSLSKWTFVDVTLNYGTPLVAPTSTFTTEKLIIVEKYYDVVEDYYVLEFHDSLRSNYPGSFHGSLATPFYNNIDNIDIRSRRTLQEISDDLQYINRLHRPNDLLSESYGLSLTLGATGGAYLNYESDIDFKIPTDSYTKILLSDYSIIRDLTGILYTDYKYELAMQITKLDREFELKVSNISLSNSKYQLQFDKPHLLSDKDYIIISMIGSQSNYPSTLLGYHNISYVNDYVVDLQFGGLLSGLPNFNIFYTKKDYFLNFQPIDLFDLGIGDKKIKQSIEIKVENYDLVGQRYDLINVDLKRFRFRLIDGMDLVQLNSEFFWILEAEIRDAIIGRDNLGNLIWYQGIWECGRWFGGNWISGAWLSGDWYEGNWTSRLITDNLLSVRVDSRNTNDYSSIWYGGRWFSGNWENGTWYDGRWYGGTWSNGRWFDGTWNDGTWNNGLFQSGIWVLGTWNNGLFNTDNGPVYWLDGKFYGGDFENGIWYNGIFDQKNGAISRFGTKASNSRQSIWRSGKFLGGQFHSLLNLDDQGNPDVSDIHKYSKWFTGLFGGGDFYGGIAYNINFKNTVWHGGILEDIEILSVSSDNTFTLKGEFDFNINDEIYIVDNENKGTFSVYGSTENPGKYKVLQNIYNTTNDTTKVYVDRSLSFGGVYGTVSNLRCVSNFQNSSWNSGLWYNGVFKDGIFTGGIWYDGYFEGTWG